MCKHILPKSPGACFDPKCIFSCLQGLDKLPSSFLFTRSHHSPSTVRARLLNAHRRNQRQCCSIKLLNNTNTALRVFPMHETMPLLFGFCTGTTVKVTTVDGLVDLKIPGGTQPGTTLVMSKRGVPRLGVANSRGDHQVRHLPISSASTARLCVDAVFHFACQWSQEV